MSWNLRRTVLTFGAVVLCSAIVLVTQTRIGLGQPVQKQLPIEVKGPATAPAQPRDEFSQAIELPKNPDMAKKIEAAQDYIKDADWETACELLQTLLQLDQDYFTKVPHKGPDGKETAPSWVSVKAEADRLLANLPKEGMEWYKLKYGPKAAEDLKKAKDSGDVQQLTIITRFYLHTDAGAEATNLLGTYQLDRGQFATAALCYAKLLNREGGDKLSPVTLVKAAYAFHMTGDKANEDICWQKLGTRLRDVRYGNETKSVDELREFIAKSGHSFNELVNFDTPMLGGGPTRSSQGVGGTPFLGEMKWRQMLTRKIGESNMPLDWISAAEKSLRASNQPMISSMQPITVTALKDNQKQCYVVYADHWGIHAVDLEDGKMKWEAPSSWSMDRMARDTKKVGAISTWITTPQWGHLALRPNILFENSTVGTLSSDGAFVFKVEDLEVPPTTQANVYNQFDGRGNQVNYGSQEVNEAVATSKMQAYDLITGKLKWEIGGKLDKDEKDERKDSYFLGPPMPLGGKLYVLMEKQQDLRLAALDPATGKLLNIQTLATAKDKMMQDVWRRIQAAHLAYGEGILVCPTNAGAVLGVDLLSNSLVWAYPYRDRHDGGETRPEEQPQQFPQRRIRGFGGPQPGPGWQMGPDGQWFNPNINTQWKVSPPVIVEGKVVFTAPDANRIHCINLRDGAAVWSDKRGADDLYLAGVFSGKALIVGKNYVRALSLTKGQEVWRVATGMPSGYGVASDNVYYLPLKEGTGQEKDPGIFAIDINKGQRVAFNKSRDKQTVGNLLFYDGKVLSQSATELKAFPQLAVQLAILDEKLGKNPNDPDGLFIRGQMRLDKGDLSGAIDDLRRSLKNNPPKVDVERVRDKLYDSFTEFFQKDFGQAEQFLKEYEELCKVSAAADDSVEAKTKLNEQRRRRANFLCLVAKGKADQGKLVEAYEKYQEFTAEADEQKLVSVVDEPFVKATPEVWSGGRIAAMVAKAKPENRKPLEEVINKKWDELKQSDDLKETRKFARMFGSLFPAGKEARLELANRLMDDSSPTAMLEAEQQLSLLRLQGEEPQMAARAVEALARLNTRKGLLEDAAYYYRLLRDQYAKVPVRDGKTGTELFDDMATDKRLLPYLDLPASLHISGKKITDVQETPGSPYLQQFYEFGHVGEELPFFQKHRLGLRFDYHQLKIIDRTTNEEKASKNLDRTNFQQMVYGNGQPNMPRFTYLTQGHLVVLPVAHRVFGIDPLHGEVLWSWNLFGDASAASGQPDPNMANFNQFMIDPKDNSLLYTYSGSWVLRIGSGGSLAGDAVVLRTREGLVALDALSGKPLWTRTSHLLNCHLFNDDQYVYMVEMDSAGNPSSTHVLRACDGTSVVEAPNFAAQYQKRVRQLGRHLLLADTDAKGQLVYRLYDVLTGKDVWTATYPATPSTHVLKSEDENFAGVVETDGTVHVLDVRTGKQVLKTKMDPQYLQKIDSVHLLYDGHYFFVACHDKMDPAVNPWGITTNLLPGTGMRGLPVDGQVYCFDAQSGKTKWHNVLHNQMIVLDHFADMPVLLATSRYQQWAVPNRQVQSVVAVEAFEKYSGKSLYEKKNPGWTQFHALNLDPRKGTIEFVNHNAKITFVARNE